MTSTGPCTLYTGGTLHATLILDTRLINWQQTIISSNARHHHHEVAKRTRVWKQLAAKAGANVTPIERGRVEVWYRFPDNIRREVSNLQPTSKAIVDGLVQQRTKPKEGQRPKPPDKPFVQLLPDDSDRYLVGPDNRRDPVNGPHQVVVRLYRE